MTESSVALPCFQYTLLQVLMTIMIKNTLYIHYAGPTAVISLIIKY